MKRSEVNQLIREAVALFDRLCVKLPPFAFFPPEAWAEKSAEYDEIRDNMLGWDITDFGSGNFDQCGLFLFTARNGSCTDPQRYPKPYAEKYMVVREGQITPYHFHWHKMEDIINRGGGNLLIRLYNATEDESGFADTPVLVQQDGRRYTVPAGTVLRLTPGESVTLAQKQYHQFWGEPGRGVVLVGEVSQVNDDVNDNRFLVQRGRFPLLEEDEAPLYLLCSEYPAAKTEA